MDFEYNGNLLEEDRINLVAKEIISKYPQISIDKAKEAAMLEGRISETKTINDELNRLYNIMIVSSNDKNIVSSIYKDFVQILYNYEYNGIYINIADKIKEYLQNDSEFPLISDYQ